MSLQDSLHARTFAPDNYFQTTIRIAGAERIFYHRPYSTDYNVLTEMLGEKYYDLGHLRHGQRFKKRADDILAAGKTPLIVDAGANVGGASLYFADAFPEARIVAIEPDAENFRLLLKNTEGLNVSCLHAAVSSEKGRLQVHLDPGLGYCSYQTFPTSAGSGNPVVDCVTINDIYAACADTCLPYYVKIDIEGHEENLFSRNTEWVAKTPIIAIELHDRWWPERETSRPFLQCVSSQNRSFMHTHELAFSISNPI